MSLSTGNMTDSGGYLTHLICEIVKTIGAEGHTLEECTNLRNRIQDLIDNKLVQFNNAAKPNVITNPLPPHQEGNVNAISIVEERIPNFSSISFLWKAMLWALAQESHIILENIGALGFDWEVY